MNLKETKEKVFFLVLAKDKRYVKEKIQELEELGFPFLIVCGERVEHPNVIYRQPKGKYDAINFGLRLIPESAAITVLNDVDTKIHEFKTALDCLERKEADLIFARVVVKEGPQVLFYRFLDAIRKWVPIAASGELMLIRHDLLKEIKSIEKCKAEDSYILFKVLERGYKVRFCEETYVETERTKTVEKEETYKRRTVSGLYQALSYTNPPLRIKIFYMLLPFTSIMLLFLGKKGYHWIRGILSGFLDYVRGDRDGSWKSTY